ncbi:hypothetical protein [Piscinibacter gummiphilus]|uniref:DUF2892 domain-containing protein n=1 Tax=Piscinibacter gummiphilus TaxID=946333 RepID=A0ABZ0CQF1_9BURK|nr:hypothetical protein [Piscinibacter gummiphilus]WOB07202.1 hypothetical protein RXV79_20070 [Piscinibacter gummiphilus]
MRPLFARSRDGLFASTTLTGHLLRGVVVFGLLWIAVSMQLDRPVASALAGIGALIVMRGCPMCWTIGLVETVAQRLRSRSSR